MALLGKLLLWSSESLVCQDSPNWGAKPKRISRGPEAQV